MAGAREEEFEILRLENEALAADNAALRAEVARLGNKLAELERRLKTSSQNSSLPPSLDRPAQKAEARKSRAERRAEERKENKETRRRGKQPGAPGEHLAQREDPDEVILHEPDRCTSCGEDLTGVAPEGTESRQVTDVPDPRPVCVEHRVVKKRCPCGTLCAPSFPLEARAPASYGPNVRALALYLLHRQHLPVERTREALAEMFGVEVSTGFLASLAPEAAGRLAPFIDAVKTRLVSSSLVHADETSDQVGLRTIWLHVVANRDATYLFASPTRGRSAPNEAGVLPDFRGVMMHDRLSMYFGYDKATHVVCGAHLVRDLASVAHRPSQVWAKRMRALLLEMNSAAHGARAKGQVRLARRTRDEFLARYDAIVEDALVANTALLSRERNSLERESYNLAVALQRRRSEVTRFIVDLSVPFTNNEAERSLRMAKLHRKISGCFQSEDHARHFATIRSYLATARKHNTGALEVLSVLFRGGVWLPPAIT
jgi:transposase